MEAKKRFTKSSVGDHPHDYTSCMVDQATAQIHDPLHDRAQAAASCLFQSYDSSIQQGFANHPKHIVHKDTELEVQFVDSILARWQTLQVKLTFEFRE